MPATLEVHETVEFPEPVMLLGEIVPQLRPVGTVSVRLTRLAKWFSEVTLIVDVADTPTMTAAGEFAEMVKSWIMKVAVAVCTRGVLVPVIVSV